MRLFLSSEGFGNYPEALLRLLRGGRRTAFIDNAKDGLPKLERRAHVEEKILEFQSYGLAPQEIDLRKYFGKPKNLVDHLAGFDLVWLSGGNTFVLRRAMAYSGLDKHLKKILAKDQIAYGGSSAGSIVAAPSLHGTELGDDPKETPKGYDAKNIWRGLNLVNFYLVPHYKSDWFGTEAEVMIGYMKKKKLPYKALIDGQVIVVNGEKEEFLK